MTFLFRISTITEFIVIFRIMTGIPEASPFCLRNYLFSEHSMGAIITAYPGHPWYSTDLTDLLPLYSRKMTFLVIHVTRTPLPSSNKAAHSGFEIQRRCH